jgi:hypothetical protein
MKMKEGNCLLDCLPLAIYLLFFCLDSDFLLETECKTLLHFRQHWQNTDSLFFFRNGKRIATEPPKQQDWNSCYNYEDIDSHKEELLSTSKVEKTQQVTRGTMLSQENKSQKK